MSRLLRSIGASVRPRRYRGRHVRNRGRHVRVAR